MPLKEPPNTNKGKLKLGPGDQSSPLYGMLTRYTEERLDTLRKKLETDLDERRTQLYRGRIAEMKRLQEQLDPITYKKQELVPVLEGDE